MTLTQSDSETDNSDTGSQLFRNSVCLAYMTVIIPPSQYNLQYCAAANMMSTADAVELSRTTEFRASKGYVLQIIAATWL